MIYCPVALAEREEGKMKTWVIELGGTFTRDIIWREVDAETEAEVREICAREMPYYRVRSITPAKPSTISSEITRSPSTSGGNSSTS